MLKMPNLMLLLAFFAGGITMQGFADPDTVDVADSMDFESFHATDIWLIGIGQDKPVKPKTDLYDAKVDPAEQQSTSLSRVADISNTSPHSVRRGDIQRQISNPYGFSSDRSTQSPTDATEVMFRNMAKQCPRGWQKDREWSTPTASGFLLHYEFHCL